MFFMKFLYSATTKMGDKVRANVEAPSRQAALQMLKVEKLTVTSLVLVERGRQIYIGGITTVQKVVFTKHLAIMLRAGIALDEALNILAAQSKGKMYDVLVKVRKEVESGTRLADALSKHPGVFNQYYVSMVRAGEESGNLTENLEQLSNRYAKDYELRQKAQGAMLYPALVLGLTFALGMVIALFVLPKLTGLFSSFKYDLPWYTKLLIFAANFLANYGLIAVVLAIASIVLFVWIVRQPFAAPVVHRIYLRLPIMGGISRTVNLARFSMVFGSLLKSGVPITQSVTITGNVLGNIAYREALQKAVKRVDTGEPLSSILEESNLFPLFATRMLMVGEQTGKLEDMLFYLSEFYENELDLTLKNLATIIEPALLIFIGAIVMGVTLSIITPIYNFIGEIG